MARPLKDGVDYFSLDVDTDADQKFQYIEAKYGIIGFGIIVKLYQMIYRNSYYCEWTDVASVICAAKWSSPEHPINGKLVWMVVRDAAKCGIFDHGLFKKYGILTSTGIQKRYFEVVKRRQKINVIEDYLLLSVPYSGINVIRNPVNVNKNAVNVNDNAERKGNSSNRKGEGNAQRATSPPAKEEIVQYAKFENLSISPEKFYEYYSARHWKGVPDWKAKMREWNATEFSRKDHAEGDYGAYDLDLFEELLNKDD